MKVKYQDLEFGYMIANADGYDSVAYLDRQTGKVYTYAEGADNFEELPEDVDNEERYLCIPEKRDFDLGIGLVMKFVSEYLPESEDKVSQMFSRRGAYARYKSHLEHTGMLDKWHEYEERATMQALREWCVDNGMEVEDC